VLLVPHHGSRTSSTDRFVHAVAPRVALVQAGYRNRFGHPVPEVVQRYSARGVAVVQTASCGAWRWNGNEESCERRTAARYWHHGLEVANDESIPRRSPWPSMSP
jgi:competence protein ComEC